jgi:endo-1,4-beta-D-glucanase Y
MSNRPRDGWNKLIGTYHQNDGYFLDPKNENNILTTGKIQNYLTF